jgi:hypothetical protein
MKFQNIQQFLAISFKGSLMQYSLPYESNPGNQRMMHHIKSMFYSEKFDNGND